MFDNKKVTAVITAAGNGSRMNSDVNKPFIKIMGKMIIEITLDKINSIDEIDDIILVIRKSDEKNIKNILKKYDKKIKVVYGGSTRELSTFNGLKEVDPDTEIVLTHDGVRPLVNPDTIRKVLKEMKNYKAAIVGVKSKDTVKVVKDDKTVDFTPPREFVYNIQTPQVFDRKTLEELYEKYVEEDITITDDSSLFEVFQVFDVPVKVVEGEYSNIKLTTVEDVVYAIELLKRDL
ncbi:MAG: 2-C-methyl-D-erythritol 4-phosphate cytidylyltransferase [Peptoniphilaceae bacterium]|nr:2-C-methyl-D-erythritol 4-phosphate cytidylyltransferase [Peptoniphilaceae bacterium]MDD7382761.1 2-C-methyl-D-erythritol 4-phosphate cytidylyltransferase [Peptoniphilaceae bacterium]MDY3737917.1 2-C-methyl-D-erythritol 4-phosphate cytidylyltransferase [Peptoniphilaceae bacterium]